MTYSAQGQRLVMDKNDGQGLGGQLSLEQQAHQDKQ